MAAGDPPFHVKALYDYPGSHEDDLSFSANQVITVTEEEDADWYNGYYEDHTETKKEGIFPKNFVKPYEPETPPRPLRANRSRKDVESSKAQQQSEMSEQAEEEQSAEPQDTITTAALAQPIAASDVPSQPTWSEGEPLEPPQPSVEAATPASKPLQPSTLAHGSSVQRIDPPTSVEKPVVGSFRDRINAFNKPAAPPVTPAKPGGLSSGGSGFIKKAFVAPPPSKSTYVPPPRQPPPQKVYRREEDPTIAAPASSSVHDDLREEQASMPVPTSVSAEEEADQPKPTSLKDRIALLQKQQAEQVARQSDIAKKKEKPKRPPRQQTPPQDPSAGLNEDAGPEDLTREQSVPGGEANPGAPSRPGTASAASPSVEAPKNIQSDTNDADQPDNGLADEREQVMSPQDQSGTQLGQIPLSLPQRSQQQSMPELSSQVDEVESNDGSEEDDDVDPEVKRRMEIRERMAKMSGGMGMAGMFGPPGGFLPKKKSSMTIEKKTRDIPGDDQKGEHEPRAPPIPIMPMPGMAPAFRNKQSEAEVETEVAVEKDFFPQSTSISQEREPEELPDMEDLEKEPVAPSRMSTEQMVPTGPRGRRAPPLPPQHPEASQPVPSARVPPPLPPTTSGRPPSSQTPRLTLSPSEGSASDDERSLMNQSGSFASPASVSKTPKTSVPSQMLPHPPEPPGNTNDAALDDDSGAESEQDEPRSPTISSPILPPPPKRASAVPPIPQQPPIAPQAPQSRAPPPPPPSAPPSRVSTGETRPPPPVPQTRPKEDSDLEVTEYEGDYDTDIAAHMDHKDALKRHEKTSTTNEDSMIEENEMHRVSHPGLGPAPRAVPPPPPSQVTKTERSSEDIPRGPPPPLPSAKDVSHQRNESYDPFNYMAPRAPPTLPPQPSSVDTTTVATSEGLTEAEPHSSTAPGRNVPPPPPGRSSSQYPSSPLAPPSTQPPTRQSTELQRNSSNMRRSMDASRPSGEHGTIARDLDLGRQVQWWTQPNMPPPVLHSRKDVLFEIEDTNTTKRGGRHSITRNVYVLYMDYSQTNISVHFDPREPSEASFEQHHEPPPARLRQDQLEDASARFGATLASAMSTKRETTVGDGSPHALILDLLKATPDALLPIGNRAYGAVVYANLANASVQQFDEIRAGDVVSFRNAKFQGHRGAMHAKYSMEVGKADHVGIVEDWDGTKKKIRAWEQGRESKKVKLESFKLGDMRSGEVKVWRVMSRQWVGWEGQN